jgi:hypothetical protein
LRVGNEKGGYKTPLVRKRKGWFAAAEVDSLKGERRCLEFPYWKRDAQV